MLPESIRKRLEKLNKVLGKLETIKGLKKSSFIDRKISSSLKEFIKLRNIIVHEYLSNYQKVVSTSLKYGASKKMFSPKIGFVKRFRLRLSIVSRHSANAELQIEDCPPKANPPFGGQIGNFKIEDKARKLSERLLDYDVEIDETK